MICLSDSVSASEVCWYGWYGLRIRTELVKAVFTARNQKPVSIETFYKIINRHKVENAMLCK